MTDSEMLETFRLWKAENQIREAERAAYYKDVADRVAAIFAASEKRRQEFKRRIADRG